jgi:translation initiation factor IF-2
MVAPPKERPPKIKERLPPPPPPAPVAAPPVVTAEIELPGPLTVGELAVKLGLGPGDVVKRLLEQRVLAGINQQIPLEAATKVAESFGSKVHKPEGIVVGTQTVAAPKRLEVARDDAAVPRPPVVTILGHVDHGKTSLLDAIRQTDVAAREFGGITQHIGASTVDVDSRRIVFIDTPGHEAFTTLRARGAQVTDIAVLVVAADDGVMPQTIEALNHAKAAAVPIVVAINKVDLPQANPDRVKQQLSDLGLVPEDWGGDTVTLPVSARTRQGIKELLEMILLVTDLQEHRANPNRPARGTILEARLDRGRGPVATVLVQEGTLRVGDAVVAGSTSGRVRAMTNDRGERLTEAPPATPAEVVGLDDVPTAGDVLEAVVDEKEAKVVAEQRRLRARASEAAATRGVEEAMPAGAEAKELRVLLKADSHGAVEALSTSLARLASPEVGVTVLHAAVGNVTESDVMLAAASRAIIIGFNIRPEPPVRKLAEQEHIDILTYRIIYEALDDIKNRLRGMRAPKRVEVSLGQAEVLKTFTISKVGTVAGCRVNAGVIPRSATVRVIRDGVVVHEGKISSLRRFKEDVREVTAGFECGIGLERFPDVKVGDVLEAFEIREEPA